MAPVTFVTMSRVRFVLKNMIQPRVDGKVVFLLRSDGSWAINIVKDDRVESHVEAKQHGLVIGENEHELDLILDKFQNHKLEVINEQIEKVKRTPSQSRHRSKKSDGADFGFSDNPNDSSGFFD